MPLLRGILEFFDSTKKCERVGHVLSDKTQKVLVRKRSDSYSSVADDVISEVHYCRNCNTMMDNPIEVDYVITDTYGKVTMPNSMWDEIRKYGYVFIQGKEKFKDPYKIV